jgi:Flp pilus assembly protein TadD
MFGIVTGVLWLAAAPGTIEQARELYGKTDYRGALQALDGMEPKTAAVYALTGRSHYGAGDFKRATDALEKAVALEPANAAHWLWLGRASGRRAETSSMLTAPGYASKARQNFEKAVALDGRGLEAMSDLLEYYLEAPGFLGGGMDKAAAMAARIAAVDAAEGHQAQYRLALKRKDFGAAEQNLRRAAALEPGRIGRWIDLGKFLARQGRHEESEQMFAKAQALGADDPRLLFGRAEAYIGAGRNRETARDLLKRYLDSALTPEHPSRAEAQLLLKKAGGL